MVLSRERDEKIIIVTPLGNVEIMVVDMRGNKVRIGIEAPRAWEVHREEIYQKIQAQRRDDHF